MAHARLMCHVWIGSGIDGGYRWIHVGECIYGGIGMRCIYHEPVLLGSVFTDLSCYYPFKCPRVNVIYISIVSSCLYDSNTGMGCRDIEEAAGLGNETVLTLATNPLRE